MLRPRGPGVCSQELSERSPPSAVLQPSFWCRFQDIPSPPGGSFPPQSLPQIGVESLEGRDLMSDIPGVVESGRGARNDRPPGRSQHGDRLNPSEPKCESHSQWQFGGVPRRHFLDDHLHRWGWRRGPFTNDTGLSEVTVMYGGGNQVVGGTGFNLASSGATITPSILRVDQRGVHLRLERQHQHHRMPRNLFAYNIPFGLYLVSVPFPFALATEAGLRQPPEDPHAPPGVDHGPPVGFPKLRAPHSWTSHRHEMATRS